GMVSILLALRALYWLASRDGLRALGGVELRGPRAWAPARLLAAGLALFGLFLLLGASIQAAGVQKLDDRVLRALTRLDHPAVVHAMQKISALSAPESTCWWLVIPLLVFLATRRLPVARAYVGMMVGVLGMSLCFSNLFFRE